MHIRQPLSFTRHRSATWRIKRFTTGILSLAILVAGVVVGQGIIAPPKVYAISTPESCFAFDAGTNTITDYYANQSNNSANPGCPRAVDIPSTIGGVAVTKLGISSFSMNQLTSVTIPNSVVNIADEAFVRNQLSSITLPNSLVSIGVNALSNNRLTSLTIPSSVKTIGTFAFAGNNISSAIFNGSVTTFGSLLFIYNPIESITYAGITHTGASSVPEACFTFWMGSIIQYNRADMNTVKNGGSACLSSTVNIPSTIGGATVTTIGNQAFYGKSLTSVTIPNSVTTISSEAFKDNSLTSLTIPSSVTNIADGAFARNTLTAVTFQGSVATIAAGTFRDTTPDSITYGGVTYSSSNSLSPACFTVLAGTITKYRYADVNTIKESGVACLSTSVNIPSTLAGAPVTGIGREAFSRSGLDYVNIPNSVTTIGDASFSNNNLTNVVIPNSVITIESWAFTYNYLESLSIGNSLTLISDYSFAFNKIHSVNLPASVADVSSSAFNAQNPGGRDLDYSETEFDIWSGEAVEAQRALDTIWYAQLYTADSTNPQGLENSYVPEVDYFGDINMNGSDGDSTGGHLINPVASTVHYKNSQGAQLQPEKSVTGKLQNGTYLEDYLVTKGPSIPASVDYYEQTPEESQAIQDALAAYYRIGTTQTFTAPAIDGYRGTVPASPYSLMLTQPTQVIDFVYEPNLHTINFGAPVGSDSNPTPSAVPGNTHPILTNSVFTVESDTSCTNIQSAQLVSSQQITNLPAGYVSVGGLNFTIGCSTVGGSADVNLQLAKSFPDSDLTKLKVYKQAPGGAITDISNLVTITNQVTPNGLRTVISYTIEDGAALDDDAQADGSITDPIYVVLPSSM
ncbi:MAG: leucine-rich repeat domain-containing protein, partial [Patescibacteria group bacterium]